MLLILRQNSAIPEKSTRMNNTEMQLIYVLKLD